MRKLALVGICLAVAGCALLANRAVDHMIGTEHVKWPHPKHDGDRP